MVSNRALQAYLGGLQEEIACPSSNGHGDNITDVVEHYLGCLAYGERDAYYNSLQQGEREHIQTKMRRVEWIRREMAGSDENSQLQNVQHSLRKWRRLRQLGPRRAPDEGSQRDNSQPDYDLDVTPQPFENEPNSSDPYDGDVDTLAHVILFDEDGRGVTDTQTRPGVPTEHLLHGEFPNQTIPVATLLRDPTVNPLARKETNDDALKIRYFHLPTNNMSWVQEAMSRYFNENSTEYDQQHQRARRRTPANNVLKYELWQGQQSTSETTDFPLRNLRPLCQIVSPGFPTYNNPATENIVLYVPYLHWDMEIQLKRIARKIHRTHELCIYLRETNVPQPEWRSLAPSFELFAEGRQRRAFDIRNFTAPSARQIIGRSALGQLLYDASVLYVELQNFRDTKLIEDYMEGRAPMHARRTLHQAYYWNNTYDEGTLLPQTQATDQSSTTSWGSNATKKTIMVDQLWLWVLDNSTVLSCFPSRYGIDEDNDTEIHRALRTRLEEEEQHGCIRSVYELSLIIMDECCHGLLDPARLCPGRPLILKMLSQTLSKVENRQRLVLRNAKRLTELQFIVAARNPGEVNPSILANISVESDLQQELTSAIGELEAMIDVQQSQLEMIRRFQQNAEILMGRHEREQKRKDSTDSQSKTFTSFEDGEDRERRLERFRLKTEVILQKAQDQFDELKKLHETADRIFNSIEQLICFKTQQATAIQAMQSAWLSRSSVQQGRAIMAFTVVTIIFLPLAFMAAVFGMNNDFLGDNSMNFGYQIKLIFAISIGVVSVIAVLVRWDIYSLVFGRLIYPLSSLVFAVIITKTRMHDVWMMIEQFLTRYNTRGTDGKVQEMYLERRHDRRQRIHRKRQEEIGRRRYMSH